MSAASFSVLVTNYNYRRFLAEALDGALAQTRAPLEVVVNDDDSDDGSPELLQQRYGNDERILLLLNPGRNGGQLTGFQNALRACRGEVIAFLDADDRWRPDYLHQIGEIFDTRKDVDFVFSDVRLIERESGRQGYADSATDLGYTALATWFGARWYGAPTSALALRRGLAERLLLTLPSEIGHQWRISADNALVFGASILGARKYFLPTGAVDYRIHDNNGWWHTRRTAGEFPTLYRNRALINLYAQRMQLDPLAFELVRHEYKTREPTLPLKERRLYARIAMQAPAAWPKRIERALGMLLSPPRHRSEG